MPATSVRERPRTSTQAANVAQPGLLASGVVAAGRAMLVSGVLAEAVVLFAWSTDGRSRGSASAASRIAAVVWLLAHRVPVHGPGIRIELAPLGLTLLAVFALLRAGATVARRSGQTDRLGAVRAGLAVGTPYGLGLLLVTGLAVTPSVRPSTAVAVVAAVVFAMVPVLGAIREVGPGSAVPDVARAAGVAVTATCAAGAVLVAFSLLAHSDRLGELLGTGNAGTSGGAVLLVASIVLLPNAAVWGAAYLMGAGFIAGAGTAVSPFSHHLGAVPAVPVLAALPAGPPGRLAWTLLAAPIAAGLYAARRLSAPTPADAVRLGAYVGLLAGAALAALAWLSGGALAPGRLATFGPLPWRAGLAAALTIGAGAIAGALAARRAS